MAGVWQRQPYSELDATPQSYYYRVRYRSLETNMIPCEKCGRQFASNSLAQHVDSYPCRRAQQCRALEERGFVVVGDSRISNILSRAHKDWGLPYEKVYGDGGRYSDASYALPGAVRVARGESLFSSGGVGHVLRWPLSSVKRWLAEMAADPTMEPRIAAMTVDEFFGMMEASR